ncbi:MAG: FAD-binding domain, partial [Rhodomicrobium sp.]
MTNKRILICGAGIAGPTLAFWLDRYGFEPVLIESAPALREGGYIIDFWGRGFDIAEMMGLQPALMENGYHIKELRIVDDKGRRSGGFTLQSIEKVLQGRYISILRSDLSRLIYGALGGRVRTVFGNTITGIEQDAGGVQVIFAHGKPERFDLVIGAGGLHSPVRNLVFGPKCGYECYLGYYAASFSIGGYPHRDPDAYISYSLPGRQVARYSLRDGRTVFLFVFAPDAKVPFDHHDQAAQKALLHERFGSGKWECPGILGALNKADSLYFDAVSQIHMPEWSNGRVALVGDACFCPSLLAGQGSALAMTATYILAGELKKAQGDHAAAFSNYEQLFRPFIERKQQAAARFATSFAPKTRFGIAVRNAVTRLMALPLVARLTMVESRMGAVAWGLWPSPRFPSPLIELDVPISGIQLSGWLHHEA